jgi:hypothetical protein
MKIKATQLKIKAMAFGGCSFTWGQGLHYYSALDSLKEDPSYGYFEGNHSIVHHLFREKWRWCSQVAQHFDTVALTHYNNGGANDQIVEYWDNSFRVSEEVPVKSFNKLKSHDLTRPVSYSDFSHFVFQFTSWMRTGTEFWVNGELRSLDTFQIGDVNSPHYREAFNAYLDTLDIPYGPNNNKLGAFHESIIKKDVSSVKDFLQKLEENGIKTYVLCWLGEHTELIEQDEWLSKRFIQFNYNDKTYRCIEDMIKDTQMDIEHDFEFFEEPPRDAHPSFKCHKVIANNVIKFIEEHNG